tara:strand:+ start:1058 stop:1447 length:390 start_codon:yes stop_codon:yes gene_type:complete
VSFGMYSRMRSDDRVWFGGECRQSSTRAIGGGMRLNVIQGARIAGAFPIIAVDVLPKRLEMATLLGATHTIIGDKGDVSLQSVTQEVRALTDQRGADVAFEVTANPALGEAPLRLVRHGGNVIQVIGIE